MRLIIVRHGQPDYEHDCLTPIGHEQARDTAERLKDEGIEAIFSSPFGRARQTAAYTAEKLGLPVEILDFIHEISWGSADGSPIFADGHPWTIADEMVRRGDDLTAPDWQSHPLFQNNRVVKEAERVARETDAWLETLGCRREGRYYRCVSPGGNKRTIALFCHGGSSTAALARIFNLPFPYLCAALHKPFASVSVIRFGGRPNELSLPCFELLSDGRHVPYGQI